MTLIGCYLCLGSEEKSIEVDMFSNIAKRTDLELQTSSEKFRVLVNLIGFTFVVWLFCFGFLLQIRFCSLTQVLELISSLALPRIIRFIYPLMYFRWLQTSCLARLRRLSKLEQHNLFPLVIIPLSFLEWTIIHSFQVLVFAKLNDWTNALFRLKFEKLRVLRKRFPTRGEFSAIFEPGDLTFCSECENQMPEENIFFTRTQHEESVAMHWTFGFSNNFQKWIEWGPGDCWPGDCWLGDCWPGAYWIEALNFSRIFLLNHHSSLNPR